MPNLLNTPKREHLALPTLILLSSCAKEFAKEHLWLMVSTYEQESMFPRVLDFKLRLYFSDIWTCLIISLPALSLVLDYSAVKSLLFLYCNMGY